MSKRRLISCLVASSLVLLLAAGIGVRMFPLEAREQGQKLSFEPIQVIQGGENLMYRAALVYPGRAIEGRVEGDVLLEISLDEHGQVSDARVLNGPEELRSPCLRSVLEWRYGPPTTMPGMTQVLIRFQLPKDRAASEIVLPAVPEKNGTYYLSVVPAGGWAEPNGELTPAQRVEREMQAIQERLANPNTAPEDKAKMERQLVERAALLKKLRDGQTASQTVFYVVADTPTVESVEKEIAELKARIAVPNTAPEDLLRMQKQLAERKAQLESVRGGGAVYFVRPTEVPRSINGKLVAIRSERVPQATQDVLFPRLGIRIGDTITEQIAQQVREIVSSFDGHLRAVFQVDDKGNVTLVIVGP